MDTIGVRIHRRYRYINGFISHIPYCFFLFNILDSKSPPRKPEPQTPLMNFPQLVNDIAYLLIIKEKIIYRIPLILDVTRIEESIRDPNVSLSLKI